MALGELEDKALKILIDHEAIAPCEEHADVYLDNGDPDAVSKAYAAAADMVKNGEVDTTKEKFAAAVNAILSEAVEDCPKCAGDDE